MSDMVKIIGLSGTNGAGKDTVGKLLADHHSYLFISVTDLLREECRKRELPVERLHLRTISAEWRREYGLGVLVDRAYRAFQTSAGDYKGLVVASLRNPYEADRVHELGGTVVWVDADPKVRYRRVQANAFSRGRKAEDDKTFEQFMADEQAEMHASGDAATLDMAAVKEKADVTIWNDSPDITTLLKDIEKALRRAD